MEKNSKRLNRKSNNVVFRGARKKAITILEDMTNRYKSGEGEDDEQVNVNVNPTDLQVGQSIFDDTGKEFVVVENQSGSTTKTLMPKDQGGQQIPSGVQTVEDSEVSSKYKLQNPATQTTARNTSRGHGSDGKVSSLPLKEFEAISIAPKGLKGKEKPKESGSYGVPEFLLDSKSVQSVSHMTNEPLEQGLVNVSKSIPKFKATLSEFKGDEDHIDTIGCALEDARKRAQEEGPVYDQWSELNSEFKEVLPEFQEEGLPQVGQPGVMEAVKYIEELSQGGYDMIDALLVIGEKFPREIANKAMMEARKRGII